MDNDTFRNQLEAWMSTGASQLLYPIPAGSGIFRIIDVPGAQYQTGYVSTSPGSFKEAGESGNWYSTTLETCFAEKPPTGNPIYEVTHLCQETPFLSVYGLPDEIQQAIYEDRDVPQSGRFTKSHIVLELAQKCLQPGSYSGVYFPSRRGDGGILTYDPSRIAVDFIYTGTQPPPKKICG